MTDRIIKDATTALLSACGYTVVCSSQIPEPSLDEREHWKRESEALAASIARAGSEDTPVEELAELALSNEPDVLVAVAGNSIAPVEVLKQLVEWEWECSDDFYISIAVAENPSATAELLEIILDYVSVEVDDDDPNEDDVRVRRVLAVNPNSTLEMLKKLAVDEDSLVRRGVAFNPYTPVELLEQLAEDETETVRREVQESLKAREDIPLELRLWISALSESFDD